MKNSNQNAQSQTVNVIVYSEPNVDVRFSNITITDIHSGAMSVTVETKTPRQRKWHDKEVVSGVISRQMKEWLMKVNDVKADVIDESTGEVKTVVIGKETGFQHFLKKKGIEFKTGILSTMEFISKNDSESYYDNPFKLIRYLNGRNELTLVNKAPLIVTESSDPVTGKVTRTFRKKTFIDKDGNRRYSYFSPSKYRRLKIQEYVPMVLANQGS